MKNVKRLLVTASVIALGACSVVDSYNEIDTLNNTDAVGSPFTQALASEYRSFANVELKENFDHPDALHFARKGLAAASGTTVLPEPLSDWNVAENYVADLATARGRIISAYDVGARESAPELSAKAQAKFDCWIEAQEESYKDGDIACKNEFMTVMDELESGLQAPAIDVVEAPAPAFGSEVFDIDPAEPMAPENAMYLIFFDWDSDAISAGAASVLDAVANEVTSTSPAGVKIIGHTDTSGAADYNQRLAVKRAKATKDELVARNVDPSVIMTDAMGENELLVTTPDNIREPANRRVNISFE